MIQNDFMFLYEVIHISTALLFVISIIVIRIQNLLLIDANRIVYQYCFNIIINCFCL